jgi:hypothetical protein
MLLKPTPKPVQEPVKYDVPSGTTLVTTPVLYCTGAKKIKNGIAVS